MAAPRKTLGDLVSDRTFLARRHSDRLLGPPLVGRADLATIQHAYKAAGDDDARQALALAFERAVQTEPPEPQEPDEHTRRAQLLHAILERGPQPFRSFFEDHEALLAEHKRDATTQRARSLRADKMTWAQIGYTLHLPPSTVRRRVAAFEKTYGYRR